MKFSELSPGNAALLTALYTEALRAVHEESQKYRSDICRYVILAGGAGILTIIALASDGKQDLRSFFGGGVCFFLSMSLGAVALGLFNTLTMRRARLLKMNFGLLANDQSDIETIGFAVVGDLVPRGSFIDESAWGGWCVLLSGMLFLAGAALTLLEVAG